MNRIVCVGYKIKKKEEEFLYKMIENVLEVKPEIIDIQCLKTNIKLNDIVITFGEKASHKFIIENQDISENYTLTEFPNIPELEPSTGNKSQRELAYTQLLKLKEKLVSDNSKSIDSVINPITEESLPDMSSKAILERIKEQGIKEWKCKSRDGKLVKITMNPEIDKEVDFNITFSELLILKAAIETLQVKEFQIVYNPKSIRKTDIS